MGLMSKGEGSWFMGGGDDSWAAVTAQTRSGWSSWAAVTMMACSGRQCQLVMDSEW